MSRLAKPTRVWARADAGVCSLCPQKQRLFFNSRSVGEECRPDLLTSLMEMSLVLCLPLCRFSSGSHACRFCNSCEVLHFAHFWQGAESIALATQNRIQTSKNGPRLSVFNTFDVEMCFSPQPRALFQARNFQNHSHAHFLIQKRSGPEVVFTFSLRMCFAPQPCALFRLPKLLQTFRPNGSVTTALASLLFDSPEPQNISRTQCSATFLPFRALGSSFFLLSLL